MQIIPLPRIVGRLVASTSALLWLSAAHAHLAVQIRGTAQLDAEIGPARGAGEVTVRGRLRDELGEPISAGKLRIVRDDVETSSAQPLPTKTCTARAAPGQDFARRGVETDPDGRFCVEVAIAGLAPGSSLRLVFQGTENYKSTALSLPLEDTRAGLVVDLGQLSPVVMLDAKELAFVADVQTMTPLALGGSSPILLDLALRSSDSGRTEEQRLIQVAIRVGTPTRVTIPTERLGQPGQADLVVAFPGDRTFKPFRNLHAIVRTRLVTPRVLNLPERVILGDRFSLSVHADTKAQKAPPGLIEIVDLEGNSAALPLDRNGDVSVTLRVPLHPRSNELSIAYRSVSPGWQAAPPLQRTLDFAPPSGWNRAAWVVSALLVLSWFVWSRRRAQPGEALATATHAPRPYAHLEIVETANNPDAGWSGVVIDAHEGKAISGAVVELNRPGFDHAEKLFATRSDALGQFEIPPSAVLGDRNCRLEVLANGYARLALALPLPGRVRVHLVSVRRAVLERLVTWAKRRGPPFDSKAEPTPDWVAEVARAKGHPTIEAWAKSVSAAAFGNESPLQLDGQDLLPPTGKLASEDPKRKDP